MKSLGIESTNETNIIIFSSFQFCGNNFIRKIFSSLKKYTRMKKFCGEKKPNAVCSSCPVIGIEIVMLVA